MKKSEVFRNARDVLLERGWCRGRLENEIGNVCVNGACNVAAFGNARHQTDKTGGYAFDDALGLAGCELWPDLITSQSGRDGWSYNDNRLLDHNNMIELLERAEKLALIGEETPEGSEEA